MLDVNKENFVWDILLKDIFSMNENFSLTPLKTSSHLKSYFQKCNLFKNANMRIGKYLFYHLTEV